MDTKNRRADCEDEKRVTMCGRYYVDDETAREIEKIVRNLDEKILRKGEIYPGQTASVIAREETEAVLQQMEWGFDQVKAGKLIINARSESALQKPMFSDSVMHRRCIIPAGWFYEWDRDKNKIAFKPQGSKGIFMAGIWKYGSDDKKHFVILTAEANDSVRHVHNRMPLILEGEECREWLRDVKDLQDVLNGKPDTALAAEGFVQQSLFP